MYRAAVITVSDRVASGTLTDRSGPLAVEALRAGGFECADPVVIADGDNAVEFALRHALTSGARVIVTTGGTGVGPRDLTPEGTSRLLDHQLLGIAEELRRVASRERPSGIISRGVAGVAGGALVVNLPGLPEMVTPGMQVVLSVADRVLEQLGGRDRG